MNWDSKFNCTAMGNVSNTVASFTTPVASTDVYYYNVTMTGSTGIAPSASIRGKPSSVTAHATSTAPGAFSAQGTTPVGAAAESSNGASSSPTAASNAGVPQATGAYWALGGAAAAALALL